tara:strand:- start:101791 stop:103263 length:1473 start_codon:yes stop_codon:yes gene_type:complete
VTAITLGLDIGTTGVKGIALDLEGGLLAQVSRSNELRSPHAGWAEADPAQWIENSHAVLAALAAHPAVNVARVVGIATTGMVPAVVALEASGVPLRRAILQNDARATAEVSEVAARLAEHDVIALTGSPVTQQSVGPTALWLARHEPEMWAACHVLVGSYDFVAMALGARPHVERNWAIESGLFDLSGAPFVPAIAAAGLDSRLAPVAAPGEVVGELSAAAAGATGLLEGIPIVVGGADHVLSAVGAGLSKRGDWLVKLGGAGDILAVSTEPITDARFYLDDHPVDGLWLPNGCMATSGSLVRWVQGVLRETDLAALDAEADQRGAAEVLCLPYFLGEKSPLNDPALRGVFAGMHLGHDRYDLYRAALEGIAFGFRHNADVLAGRGIELTAATVTNGGATSLFWKRIHASVLGTPLRTVQQHPGASLAAAVAAAIGVGGLDDWSTIERFVIPGDTVDPEPALVERYDEAYALWRELSDVTATTMRALARR